MIHSNLECWKTMQEQGYFEKHPRYKGILAFGKETLPAIEQFTKLQPHYKVVVLGCGYGREVIQIASFVNHIYGIDVNQRILQKARTFVSEHGVKNFTGVLVDRWRQELPEEIDLVYSMVVMQHLTRDLVKYYFEGLEKKLSPNGMMIVQFLEHTVGAFHDADLRIYEPQITWTREEIEGLGKDSGLLLRGIKTIQVGENSLWHWSCFERCG